MCKVPNTVKQRSKTQCGCWDVDACYNSVGSSSRLQSFSHIFEVLPDPFVSFRHYALRKPGQNPVVSTSVVVVRPKIQKIETVMYWHSGDILSVSTWSLVAHFSSQRQWVADFSINSCSRQRFVGDLHLLLRCLVGMISNNPTNDYSILFQHPEIRPCKTILSNLFHFFSCFIIFVHHILSHFWWVLDIVGPPCHAMPRATTVAGRLVWVWSQSQETKRTRQTWSFRE